MPTVSLVDASQAPLLAQAYYAAGDPGPLVTALAHVPEVLDVALPFIGTVLGESAIDLRTKEIVILRTSVVQECRYCTQTHTAVACDADLSLAEVQALRGETAITGAFTDARELALLGWVDAVALGPGTPDPALAAGLRAHFADHEIVELTLLVGATLMLNRFATSLGLPTSPATLERLAEENLV
ncbi:MAG: carboxymuconolactone decarboxylase family protein [Actinomycetota bacterium]|nr:carboxymuconolactone decarboxylase family protein [Actinomycetota bacterium]